MGKGRFAARTLLHQQLEPAADMGTRSTDVLFVTGNSKNNDTAAAGCRMWPFFQDRAFALSMRE